MPNFTIQAPDGRQVTIQAADQATAMQGAQQWYASQQPPSTLEDVGRSAWGHLVRMGASALNGINDIPSAIESAAAAGNKAGSAMIGQKADPSSAKLAGDIASSILNLPGVNAATRPPLPGQTSTPASRAVSALAAGKPAQAQKAMTARPVTSAQISAGIPGGGYQAKTLAGKVAGTLVDFAPALIGSEGTLLQRGAQWILPALGSEGAGQLAKDTPFEAPARLAGAVLGGGLAGMVPGAGTGAIAETATPTLEDLTNAKNAAYKAVDDLGVEYKPDAVNSLVQGVKDDTQQAMIDPDLHPRATAVVKRISALQDQPVTLGKLDQVRRLVRDNVISSASSPDEARIGRRILDNIDEFVGAAGPEQVTAASGDAEQAAQTLNNARQLNTQVRKIETVNDALDAARLRAGSTGSGGNINNATRQELRKVLQNGHFTDEESQALEDVILGTPGQNVLRQIGKLSPSGNGLSMVANLGAAGATHGASLPISAAGMAAKFAADQMTKQRVADLIDLIASGGGEGAGHVLTDPEEASRVLGLYRNGGTPLKALPRAAAGAMSPGVLLPAALTLSRTQQQ